MCPKLQLHCLVINGSSSADACLWPSHQSSVGISSSCSPCLILTPICDPCSRSSPSPSLVLNAVYSILQRGDHLPVPVAAGTAADLIPLQQVEPSREPSSTQRRRRGAWHDSPSPSHTHELHDAGREILDLEPEDARRLAGTRPRSSGRSARSGGSDGNLREAFAPVTPEITLRELPSWVPRASSMHCACVCAPKCPACCAHVACVWSKCICLCRCLASMWLAWA